MVICSDRYYKVKGTVVKGLGEGAKYVKIYEDVLRKHLGFKPYPGTLNVKLCPEDVVVVKNVFADLEPVVIPPPSDSYGKVFAWKAYVKTSGSDMCVEIYIVKPEKTAHGDDIVEVLSHVNLKEALDIATGNAIDLVIPLDKGVPCECRVYQNLYPMT